MNVYEFILAMNFWQWCGLVVLFFWVAVTTGFFSRWKPYYSVTNNIFSKKGDENEGA